MSDISSAAVTPAHDHASDMATRLWGPRWRLRIGRVIGIILCIAILFSPSSSVPGSWADVCFRAAAWLLWMAGGTLRFWATLYIGGRKARTVIDEGPYSVCRNPLYLGSLMLAASATLFLHSLTFAIGIALLMVLYARGTVPAEERLLRERFGAAYVAYCRRVPRYWPRLSGFRSAPTVEVTLKQLGREYGRAMLWLWLPLLGDVIDTLRHQPWWPHLIKLV